MNSLAIIPARAGSTRLINKNIYPLLDKPLIRWITEAVISSELFSKILISTDSDDIFAAVKDLPVERHIRDSVFATTESTVLEAVLNIMETSKEAFDVVGYFLPTCPFISAKDICKGMSMLNEDTAGCGDVDSVVSMTLMAQTVQLACVMHDDYVMPIFDNLECGMTNSKFIKQYYKPSGAFYLGKWDHILATRNFFKGKVKGVKIPINRSIDINTLEDILYAQAQVAHDNMRVKKL